MSGKLIFALFLALQVSMSLCDIPETDQELADKFRSMTRRLAKACIMLSDRLVEAIGQDNYIGIIQALRDIYNKHNMPDINHLQAVFKDLLDVAQAADEMVNKTVTAGLGLYGQYLRPHIGTYLDDAIEVVVDKLAPTV